MHRLSLETVANLALVIMCGVVTVAVANRLSASSPQLTPRSVAAVGKKMPLLPGVSFRDSPATLVLMLRSTCVYCTQSMAFYRDLSVALRRDRGVRIIAASAEPSETLRQYVDNNRLNVDGFTTLRGDAALQPTPTLVLVDSRGIVTDVWLGKLDSDNESRVRDALPRLLRRVR